MDSSKLYRVLFFIILACATILRFYKYADFSITADEVSAINRAQFISFSKLIDKGVLPDTHPAGVQVFLYFWIKWFGISEAAVRFPFVIAGIGSVVFVYLIAANWFGKLPALTAMAAMAFLQFPITFSQLARPYAPGLLFSLSTVYFFTLFFFQKRHTSFWVVCGYVLSSAACLYTHYFSALFAVMVAVTGLFFLNKENYKNYFISGIVIVLLFVPHLKIFIHQFSKGGIGGADGWLAPPTSDFFSKHLWFIFNESKIIVFVFTILILIPLIVGFRKQKFSIFHIISIVWFVLPGIIGYYYSIRVNPLLQNSILLFSFPFIIIFATSFVKASEKYKKVLFSIPLLVIIIGVYNTVIRKDFYHTQRFGVLKDIAQKTIESDEKYGEQNITRTINLVGAYSIHYNLSKYGKRPTFKTYKNNGGEELKNFAAIIDSSATDYFLYAWSTLK